MIPEINAWSLKSMHDPWNQCLIPEINAWSLKSMLDPWNQCMIPEINDWSLKSMHDLPKSMHDPWNQCMIPEINAWTLKSMHDPINQCMIPEINAWSLKSMHDPWYTKVLTSVKTFTGWRGNMGQRSGMTNLDLEKINTLYSCNMTIPISGAQPVLKKINLFFISSIFIAFYRLC